MSSTTSTGWITASAACDPVDKNPEALQALAGLRAPERPPLCLRVPGYRHRRPLLRRPARDPAAKPIADVRDPFELEGHSIGFSASPLGSGGMRSKVVAADMATAAGIPAVIARGTDPAAVRAALGGERTGTRFHPRPGKVSSFKLWLRYAKPAHGTIGVDEGAALRERGTSLLPVRPRRRS